MKTAKSFNLHLINENVLISAQIKNCRAQIKNCCLILKINKLVEDEIQDITPIQETATQRVIANSDKLSLSKEIHLNKFSETKNYVKRESDGDLLFTIFGLAQYVTKNDCIDHYISHYIVVNSKSQSSYLYYEFFARLDEVFERSKKEKPKIIKELVEDFNKDYLLLPIEPQQELLKKFAVELIELQKKLEEKLGEKKLYDIFSLKDGIFTKIWDYICHLLKKTINYLSFGKFCQGDSTFENKRECRNNFVEFIQSSFKEIDEKIDKEIDKQILR